MAPLVSTRPSHRLKKEAPRCQDRGEIVCGHSSRRDSNRQLLHAPRKNRAKFQSELDAHLAITSATHRIWNLAGNRELGARDAERNNEAGVGPRLITHLVVFAFCAAQRFLCASAIRFRAAADSLRFFRGAESNVVLVAVAVTGLLSGASPVNALIAESIRLLSSNNSFTASSSLVIYISLG